MLVAIIANVMFHIQDPGMSVGQLQSRLEVRIAAITSIDAPGLNVTPRLVT